MNLHSEMAKLIPELSDDDQIELVKENYEVLKYVTSYKAMLTIVNNHGHSIQYIKDQLKDLRKKNRNKILAIIER